jgi:hypothetical protein
MKNNAGQHYNGLLPTIGFSTSMPHLQPASR